jgi:hypothetical protein
MGLIKASHEEARPQLEANPKKTFCEAPPGQKLLAELTVLPSLIRLTDKSGLPADTEIER